MTATLRLPGPDASDRHRRALLREADLLLTQVEELRLARRRSVPRAVQLALRSLQARTGTLEKATRRHTLRSAQNAIFAVQQRLMAANPNGTAVRTHPGRAVGTPVVEPIRPGVRWKLLVLPPQPSAPEHSGSWRDLVEATVERALERWFYAQHHAVAAARERNRPQAALMVARVAWNNYWELHEEAERIRAPAREAA